MHGPVPLRAGWTPFGKGESPGEIKRREVSWSLKLAQKKSRAGRRVGLHFASVVTQQQCYGHCPCDCSAQQLKQQLHGTPVYLLCNGQVTALTLLWLFWRAVHGLLSLPGRCVRSSLHSFSPCPCP